MRNLMSAACVLGVGGLGGLAACDDTNEWPSGPVTSTVSVTPLDLPDLEGPYSFELALTGPSGPLHRQTGLRPAQFGSKPGEITYIAACDASGDGLNRLELTALRDPGERTTRQAPRLTLPETQVGVRCIENQDVVLGQRMVAAELERRDTDTRVRFDDVRCVATQACAPEGNALEVRCARPGGKPVALGIRDARLSCGSLEEALDPLGTTHTRLGVSAVTRDVGRGDGRDDRGEAAWRAELSPADLAGCTFEAELVAAADLDAGQAPACHAWPVLEVALPLGGACDGGAELAVSFAEAGGPTLDAVVENRAARLAPMHPMTPAETACAARQPVVLSPNGTTNANLSQGFLDLHLELVFPR